MSFSQRLLLDWIYVPRHASGANYPTWEFKRPPQKQKRLKGSHLQRTLQMDFTDFVCKVCSNLCWNFSITCWKMAGKLRWRAHVEICATSLWHFSHPKHTLAQIIWSEVNKFFWTNFACYFFDARASKKTLLETCPANFSSASYCFPNWKINGYRP